MADISYVHSIIAWSGLVCTDPDRKTLDERMGRPESSRDPSENKLADKPHRRPDEEPACAVLCFPPWVCNGVLDSA